MPVIWTKIKCSRAKNYDDYKETNNEIIPGVLEKNIYFIITNLSYILTIIFARNKIKNKKYVRSNRLKCTKEDGRSNT